jgi:SSS family solute:Na+ symporter
MILMAAATLCANNLYRAVARPGVSEREVSRVARTLVPLLAAISVYFTLSGGETIVALLLMGYNLVTQLFPALVLSLGRENVATRQGALAGIVVGVATVALTSLANVSIGGLFPGLPSAIKDLNIGIVALLANAVVLVVVSAIGRTAALGEGKDSPAPRRG